MSRLNAPLTEEELAREAEWKADPELAFEEGVEIAFARWEALTIAVNNMGGPDVQDKVDEFINTAIEWFLDDKEAIHWDDVEGWLLDVLSEEFHVDAQDGSGEAMGRLLCTLYDDCFRKADFAGLQRMKRTLSEVQRAQLDARRIGQAESDRHNRLMEAENEADSDLEEGEDEEDDEQRGVAGSMATVSIASSAQPAAAASSSAANGPSGSAAASGGSSQPEAASSSAAAGREEEKTAEQLQDEADGWETVPKRGKGKGGKK